jgi:predicted nuclease of restriction endonuclease-like (RecB) superfamily
MRIANEQARRWYMQEAGTQGWPVRVLLRQITSFAYERTLRDEKWASRDRNGGKSVEPRPIDPREFIKDPYVLEFLGTNGTPGLRENAFEQAIIDRLQDFTPLLTR